MYEPRAWIPNHSLHVANMAQLHSLVCEAFVHACIFVVHDGMCTKKGPMWSGVTFGS